MRRPLTLSFCAVALLALPTIAGATQAAPRDGTLSIEDGKGVVVLHVKGGVIGRFAKGSMTITDKVWWDEKVPIVFGENDEIPVSTTKIVYPGENVRFRLPAGTYVVRINAVGIDLSAVGKGRVWLRAKTGVEDPGEYALNGDSYRPLPEQGRWTPLEAPPPAP